MLSESQERMLIIVHKGREEEVKRIFDKWDLPWSEIGIVTDTGRMVVQTPRQGRGRYSRQENRRRSRRSISARPRAGVSEGGPRLHAWTALPDTQDPLADLKALLRWPTIASKNWVYRQYDHMVRDGTVGLPRLATPPCCASRRIRCP